MLKLRFRGFLLMSFFLSLFVSLFTCFFTTSAHAQVSMSRFSWVSEAEFKLFASTGLGYSRITGDDYVGVMSGRQFAAMAVVSPRWDNLLTDVGLGWQHHRVAGRSTQAEDIDIITHSAYLDINPRYAFWDYWQAGPLINVLLGADNQFGPLKKSRNETVMWGARLVHEQAFEDFDLRIFGQTLWESTIKNRQVVNAMVGVMIGMPVTSREVAQEDLSRPDEPVAYVEEAPLPQPVVDDAPKPVLSEVRISLDPKQIFFNTNSAEIKPEVRQLLKRIGSKLQNESTQWTSVDVVGHADQRGPATFNQKLSAKRAEAVNNELMSAGLSRSKVQTAALGEAKPKDPRNNPQAWAKNRRVELVIRGVEDPEHIREILSPLATLKPSNTRM